MDVSGESNKAVNTIEWVLKNSLRGESALNLVLGLTAAAKGELIPAGIGIVSGTIGLLSSFGEISSPESIRVASKILTLESFIVAILSSYLLTETSGVAGRVALMLSILPGVPVGICVAGAAYLTSSKE